MGEFNFELNKAGRTLWIEASGYFCHKNRATLDRMLDAISKVGQIDKVAFNASELDYIDLHAIGNLVILNSFLSSAGIKLVILADNPFMLNKLAPLEPTVPVRVNRAALELI